MSDAPQSMASKQRGRSKSAVVSGLLNVFHAFQVRAPPSRPARERDSETVAHNSKIVEDQLGSIDLIGDTTHAANVTEHDRHAKSTPLRFQTTTTTTTVTTVDTAGHNRISVQDLMDMIAQHSDRASLNHGKARRACLPSRYSDDDDEYAPKRYTYDPKCCRVTGRPCEQEELDRREGWACIHCGVVSGSCMDSLPGKGNIGKDEVDNTQRADFPTSFSNEELLPPTSLKEHMDQVARSQKGSLGLYQSVDCIDSESKANRGRKKMQEQQRKMDESAVKQQAEYEMKLDDGTVDSLAYAFNKEVETQLRPFASKIGSTNVKKIRQSTAQTWRTLRQPVQGDDASKSRFGTVEDIIISQSSDTKPIAGVCVVIEIDTMLKAHTLSSADRAQLEKMRERIIESTVGSCMKTFSDLMKRIDANCKRRRSRPSLGSLPVEPATPPPTNDIERAMADAELVRQEMEFSQGINELTSQMQCSTSGTNLSDHTMHTARLSQSMHRTQSHSSIDRASDDVSSVSSIDASPNLRKRRLQPIDRERISCNVHSAVPSAMEVDQPTTFDTMKLSQAHDVTSHAASHESKATSSSAGYATSNASRDDIQSLNSDALDLSDQMKQKTFTPDDVACATDIMKRIKMRLVSQRSRISDQFKYIRDSGSKHDFLCDLLRIVHVAHEMNHVTTTMVNKSKDIEFIATCVLCYSTSKLAKQSTGCSSGPSAASNANTGAATHASTLMRLTASPAKRQRNTQQLSIKDRLLQLRDVFERVDDALRVVEIACVF